MSVKPTGEKHLVCLFYLSVCLIDHPTTIALPEIAVRDYLFGEPRLFFKWPYLSLKKMRHLGTNGGGKRFFWFFGKKKISVRIDVGLVVIKGAIFLSLRTLGICRLVLLAGGVSIMSRLLCLKNVALAVSVSDFKSLFLSVDARGCSIRSRRRFLGVKLV